MYNSRYGYSKKNKRKSRLIIKQMICCILIMLVIVTIKRIDYSATNNIVEVFQNQYEKDYKITNLVDSGKNLLGKAKGIPAYISSKIENDRKIAQFSPPADESAVISVFGNKSGESEGFQRGMDFYSGKEIQVYSVGSGTVSEVGENSQYGKFIKINHGNNQYSVYGNCTSIYVEPLEYMRKGQLIASVSPDNDNYFHFELWIDDEIVNPADYINF